MHTDEYEISLRREIDVCRTAVAKAEKALSDIERTYGVRADGAAADLRNAGPGDGEVYSRWLETYEGLRAWSEKLAQYEQFLKLMKQSQ